MASNAENVSIWWRHHDILVLAPGLMEQQEITDRECIRSDVGHIVTSALSAVEMYPLQLETGKASGCRLYNSKHWYHLHKYILICYYDIYFSDILACHFADRFNKNEWVCLHQPQTGRRLTCCKGEFAWDTAGHLPRRNLYHMINMHHWEKLLYSKLWISAFLRLHGKKITADWLGSDCLYSVNMLN